VTDSLGKYKVASYSKFFAKIKRIFNKTKRKLNNIKNIFNIIQLSEEEPPFLTK